VYGRSFGRAAETENLALGYVRETGDRIAIGVLHANVGGDPDYDPYAPASIDDLRAARMDYWALGHIHKQEVLARDPWIVYSGSTQGLNPKETGPHGCLVVEVSSSGEVHAEHVETAPVAWAQGDCDVSSAETIEEVHRLLTAACDTVRADSGRPTVARLSLIGRSPVHGELVRPGLLPDVVESVRREQSVGHPWVWIDRIADKTASVLDLDAIRAGGDFSAELLRIADELSADPSALRTILDEIVEPLGVPLPGYEPGVEPEQVLMAARDAALDLLLVQGGERS
jgi:DNA repair exonuclease SbcCD nuclease subunit